MCLVCIFPRKAEKETSNGGVIPEMEKRQPQRETSQRSYRRGSGNDGGGRKKTGMIALLIVAAILLVVVDGWLLVKILGNRTSKEDAPIETVAQVNLGTMPTAAPETTEAPTVPTTEAVETTVALTPLEEAKQKNSDVVGWLSLGGTDIDLPVVQTTDNTYYMSHDLDRNSSKFGIPYVDFECKVSSGKHLIIYGTPGDTSGSQVFAQLRRYKDPEYAIANPAITLETEKGVRTYEIRAAYVITNNKQDKDFFSFNSTEHIKLTSTGTWQSYLNEIKSRAYYTADDFLKVGDEFLTLYTSGEDGKNSRFLVVAELLPEGETAEITEIKLNSNPKIPKF